MQNFTLLEPGASAIAVENGSAGGDIIIVCEHASRLLPERLGALGLDAAALESHIAWDPGALELSRNLSVRLDAALYYQRYSRLVYDCNRPPEAMSAIPEKSEIFEIPGNRDISGPERQARINEVYIPFRNGLHDLISRRKAMGRPTILVTIHSFTPIYFGKKREVEIGILHDGDSRLADAMLLETERQNANYSVMRNQPYGPADGVTHTLLEHGIANGIPNVMIEVRNDLLTSAQEGAAIAAYLSTLIGKAASALGGQCSN